MEAPAEESPEPVTTISCQFTHSRDRLQEMAVVRCEQPSVREARDDAGLAQAQLERGNVGSPEHTADPGGSGGGERAEETPHGFSSEDWLRYGPDWDAEAAAG